MRARKDASYYLDGIFTHERAVLSQAITLVESTRLDDRLLAETVVEACMKQIATPTRRIGISGAPGCGKSTFIEAFGLRLTEQGHQIAVLAVDPSSQRTGGSILGDKTRMQFLAQHAYIRPSPSGDATGGVQRHTRESIILCEAAGFDLILVETVGVGQSEVAVASMVDFFLVLLLPRSGDDLQGIKRGIMEMADGLVITKADGDNISAAHLAAQTCRQALAFFTPQHHEWRPPVCEVSALEKHGLDEVGNMLELYYNTCMTQHRLHAFRQHQLADWFQSEIEYGLKTYFYQSAAAIEQFRNFSVLIERGELSPSKAARLLLSNQGFIPEK